ncbi:uncharacterized protein FOMMEDRAFT_25592 [Fomitiporia mediterranea MF3/22]|uniref:uncharacterized protein n=1 Tax=Fomitiporia mediterranea (strain MF3/22) TaxID=694068 RepID=UPI0004407974|nr:uncharacterized protein FOMMEDRAFT_25592 [Fomitiporia mediterranea MF3/22]EJD08569.1 hypothetical protein FOMMEDRAFT_25592 [Fomitiporia mediterranea MF3/22]
MHSLSRSSSDSHLLSSAPSVYTTTINIATDDVSALLSHIADLEAELDQISSSHPVSNRGEYPCGSPGDATEFCSEDLVKTRLVGILFSLPLMQVVINTTKTFVESGLVVGLEDELISVIQEAARDISGPWSNVFPKPPPITGPRTPEQYLCMVDIALSARKEAKRVKKIAKYWKRLALQATSSSEDDGDDVGPLTPSPSDISDTGISDLFSSVRKDRVQELIERRRCAVEELLSAPLASDAVLGDWDTVAHARLLQAVDSDDSSAESDSPRSSFDIHNISATSLATPTSMLEKGSEQDRTLVESIETALGLHTKTETFIPSPGKPANASDRSSLPSTPVHRIPSNSLAMTQSKYKTEQPLRCETPGASVRSRHLAYESITSNKSAFTSSLPTPIHRSPQPRKASATTPPSSSPRSKIVTVSPKSPLPNKACQSKLPAVQRLRPEMGKLVLSGKRSVGASNSGRAHI